jgi:hypothetical protein
VKDSRAGKQQEAGEKARKKKGKGEERVDEREQREVRGCHQLTANRY